MVRWFKSAIRPSLAIEIPLDCATSFTRNLSICVLSLLYLRLFVIISDALTYGYAQCMLCIEYILLSDIYSLALKEGRIQGMKQETIVLSLVLTTPDHKPAYELSIGNSEPGRACELLSVEQASKNALVDFVRKLYRTAQEMGLLAEQYNPCLFAGRLESV